MPEPTKRDIDKWQNIIAKGSDYVIADSAMTSPLGWNSGWRHEMCIAEFKRRALAGKYAQLTDAQAMLLMEVTT